MRNSQMNNKRRQRKARPNGLMFFTAVEGLIHWSQTIWHAEHQPGEAGRYLAADHGNINARHFVSLCVLFFPLNIYFLCFARTQFPSHVQSRLFLRMGGRQGTAWLGGPVIGY